MNTQYGYFSFVDGFKVDPSLNRFNLEHQQMMRQIQRFGADDVFDELLAAGKTAEASWLVDHIERFTH